MPLPMRTEVRSYILKSVLCAVVYAASIFIGLLLVPADGSGASLVWPVAAVGLALLYLFGEELWPAMLLSGGRGGRRAGGRGR